MSTLLNQTDNSKLYELCKLKIMEIEPKCGLTKSRHEIISLIMLCCQVQEYSQVYKVTGDAVNIILLLEYQSELRCEFRNHYRQ